MLKENKSKKVVISLGGSIIAPGEVDAKFVNSFKKLIEDFVKRGYEFILVTGGGVVARKYQKALKNITGTGKNDLDWIGIYSTRLNAQLLRLALQKHAHKEVIIDPEKVKSNIQDKVIIGAGWKPGWSTDYVSVKLAVKFRAKTVINLSNIDYIYTKDPRKFKDAKKIKEISWNDFKKLVGGKWTPGANLPFDPIASKLAARQKIQVVVMNGRKIENLKSFLAEKPFRGSVIK